MLTTNLETKAERVATNAAHVKALLLALGNPSEWTYTGEVIDAGPCSEAHCACGHDIRYCFIISHPVRGQTQVGSTCINHIALISPELGAQLQEAEAKLLAELAEAKAKAKRAAADAENVKLWEQYVALRDEAKRRHADNRARYVKSPYDLWYFVQGWHEKYRTNDCPEYTRAGDLRKWLEKAIARVQTVLNAH